jgi:HEAT repeat protein
MCGPPAIPALTALLNRPDPSGLFELRCRAIAALAALGDSDALIGFIGDDHELSDPVARAGEDAVVSTAARTLGLMGERRAVPLIVRLAMRRPLPGMIDALGHFHDPQSIPALIRGLDEDDCRSSAENALQRLGPKSCDALLRAAGSFSDDGSLGPRGRRSAMKVLAEVGIEPHQRRAVRRLIWDEDAEVSLHAAHAYFRSGLIEGREEILQRLSELVPQIHWTNRGIGEDLLKTYATVGHSGSITATGPARPAASR